MDKYTTIQGDTWDIIAYKVYGNSMYMDRLIEANPRYTNVFIFSANISIDVPKIEADVSTVVPPWKK